MATPKSTIERVRRKLRPKKIKTPHDDHNMGGRVVVKKTGNNDPRRNHWAPTAEAYLRYYRGEGEHPKNIKAATHLTETFIKAATHFEGKFPLKLERLVEMREEHQKLLAEATVTADADPES